MEQSELFFILTILKVITKTIDNAHFRLLVLLSSFLLFLLQSLKNDILH